MNHDQDEAVGSQGPRGMSRKAGVFRPVLVGERGGGIRDSAHDHLTNTEQLYLFCIFAARHVNKPSSLVGLVGSRLSRERVDRSFVIVGAEQEPSSGFGPTYWNHCIRA